MTDDLYGGKGIDTPYERQIFDYHPKLEYPIEHSIHLIPPVVVQKIERAQNFTITQSLMDYDSLSQDISDLMAIIEDRQSSDFQSFEDLLAADDYQQVMAVEDEKSGYDGTGDYEIYDLLYRMKRSVDRRRDFLDQYYRSQITDATDVSDAADDEANAIQSWSQSVIDGTNLENSLMDLYKSSYEVDDPTTTQQIQQLQDQIAQNQLDTNNMETFHTTIADVAYVHKNRYTQFQDIVDSLRDLVTNPASVMESNGMKSFLQTISSLTDVSAIKSHLILAFQSLKQQHNNLKGQALMVDDNKEDAISKQLWMYQQVHTKTTNPLIYFLYNQDEGQSATFDRFATIITDSMQNVQDQYNQSIIDLVKLYQQEAVFYGRQVDLLQKKEEIRQFLRILEDLGDVTEVTDDWIDDYLKAHGYSNS